MTQKELSLTLENLKLQLQVLCCDSDIEVAHCDADHVLIDAIKCLAEAHFGTIPPEVQAIIAAYRNVPKWYA